MHTYFSRSNNKPNEDMNSAYRIRLYNADLVNI